MTYLFVVLVLLIAMGGYFYGFARGKALRETQEDNRRREAEQQAQQLLDSAQAQAQALRAQAGQEAQGALTRAEAQLQSAEREAQSLLQRAQREGQALSEEARQHLQEAQRQAAQLLSQGEQQREEVRREVAAERAELIRERDSLHLERQDARREREELGREIERLGRRAEQLDARGERLEQLEERLEEQQAKLRRDEDSARERLKQAELKLYEVAALSPEQAREQVLSTLDAQLEEEKAVRVRLMQERASQEAKRSAQNIIAQAIQRSAAETSAVMSVSVVPLPSDAMKGRLIGREGRNIRAFESLTGVDLIIDDTPEAVMLSSFNPIRREVARHVLSSLVQDGRIHPSRIEEMVQKAQDEMKSFIHTQGEEAASEAGVLGLKPGIVQLLGRMYFRSSYGQNVLKHSLQVAHLTGVLAAELGLDSAMARRAGLLHDIGKSIDRELEGTHVDIGISLGKRFGEPSEVIDAIAHHHDPENGETLYSVLVAAADAISAARPGARREELEQYIKRLETLEHIALSFPGVQQAYAIQAGREVRVLVTPDEVSDAQATLLSRDIASRIEEDMEYPGQVQVTVIRESRSVEYAR